MKLQIAELKKRFMDRPTLSVTIESERVLVYFAPRAGEGSAAASSFSLPIGAEAVLANPENTGRELAANLATNGIRERRCVVCLPSSWALTSSTEVPEISGEDLYGYFELRAERVFPMPLAEMRLAHCLYFLPDGQRRATLAAVASKKIEAVERMLTAAGCRPVSISLGLQRFLASAEAPAALHFMANGNHVDVIVAAGTGIAALRSLPAVLKPGHPDFDAAGFFREVRITLGGLPESVRQQVAEARFGGTPETAENLCIEIRGPLRGLGIKSLVTREASSEQLSSGIGGPVVFEFIPAEVPRWQKMLTRFDNRRQRWLFAAAGALVLLPMLIFVVRSHMENSLEAEWNAMRGNVAELESLQQKIRQFRPWFEPVPQSLQALEGLATAFPETGEVWAKSIQLGESAKISCSGFAKNQTAWLGFLERLRGRPEVASLQVQQVKGDNPVQFAITYKWEAHDAAK